MTDNFGMMEGAYFVGRNELLNWLNDLLQLGYTKVEQVASGASHCQVMDAVHPGKVPLHKVNFNAKHEYEFVKNYKVLQEIFNKIGIDKYIDVQKLTKAKYQDNLEFLQWIKRYYDLHYPGGKYSAVERRKEAKCPYEGDSKPQQSQQPQPATQSEPAHQPQQQSSLPTAPKSHIKADHKQENVLTSGAVRVKNSRPSVNTGKVLKPVNRDPIHPPAADKQEDKSKNSTDDSAKLAKANQQIVELKLAVDGLEKESYFYFNKLREVEILCQNVAGDSHPLLEKILTILYATDDENFTSAESAQK